MIIITIIIIIIIITLIIIILLTIIVVAAVVIAIVTIFIIIIIITIINVRVSLIWSLNTRAHHSISHVYPSSPPPPLLPNLSLSPPLPPLPHLPPQQNKTKISQAPQPQTPSSSPHPFTASLA